MEPPQLPPGCFDLMKQGNLPQVEFTAFTEDITVDPFTPSHVQTPEEIAEVTRQVRAKSEHEQVRYLGSALNKVLNICECYRGQIKSVEKETKRAG